jgi:hypothetical protein
MAAWKPSEVRRFRQMVDDKLSWAIIADMLGRSELSIWSKADRLGLKRPPSP